MSRDLFQKTDIRDKATVRQAETVLEMLSA
jgi:hypothetical protein